MKKIVLVTGNQRKVDEAMAACIPFGIEVDQVKLEIDEIQSKDPQRISKDKAKKAYFLINVPVVVTDTFWNIPSLNGFPGAYMKDVAEWFKPEDFLNLVLDKDDKRISFTESLTYIDETQVKTFSKEYWGEFADKPKGTGNPIEVVAKFGGRTIGENRDLGKLSHDPKDYIWFEFAEWYSKQ